MRVLNGESPPGGTCNEGTWVDLSKGMYAGAALAEEDVFVVMQKIAAVAKAGTTLREGWNRIWLSEHGLG